MNAANAADLLAQPDIDGGLIGGASLKAPISTPSSARPQCAARISGVLDEHRPQHHPGCNRFRRPSALIGLILVQHGKGAPMMGASLGSAADRAACSCQRQRQLPSRTTAALATVFVRTLVLAYFGIAQSGSTGSVLENAYGGLRACGFCRAGSGSWRRAGSSCRLAAPATTGSGSAQIPGK